MRSFGVIVLEPRHVDIRVCLKEFKEGGYQYGDWLYTMLVVLLSMIEERESSLVHHSTRIKAPPV